MSNLQPSQTVLEALEVLEVAGNDPGVVTLSNGVVLRIQSIGKDAYLKIISKFKKPVAPITVSQKGRKEENVNDPRYKEELAQYRADLAMGVTSAVYALGVELISVPDNVMGPDHPGWLEKLRLSSLSSGDSDEARLLDWLLHYAAKSNADNQLIMRSAGRMLGTPEADVQDATKSV